MKVNTLLDGSIEYNGDVDFFAFHADEGALYNIQTLLPIPGLHDSYLEFFDMDGTTLLASDDDEGGGLASEILWMAPEGGLYFVKVRPFAGGDLGAYQIWISGPCTSLPSDGFRPADVNKDGHIDAVDLMMFIEDYGEVYPTPTPSQ
jgi:hypothetical protein